MIFRVKRSPPWALEEPSWDPDSNSAWESRFCLANGYLGIRGYPEEPFGAGPSYRAVSVTCLSDPEEDDPALTPVADLLATEIGLSGTPVRMRVGAVEEYSRSLDFKSGLLYRRFVFRDAGKATRLEFERFASVHDPHILGQSIAVTPLNWSGEIRVSLWMDARGLLGVPGQARILHAEHLSRDRLLLATER